MKKAVAFLFAVLMLISLTACGEQHPAVVVNSTPANVDPLLAITDPEEAASYLMAEILHAAKNGDKERFSALCADMLPESDLQTTISNINSYAVSYNDPVIVMLDQNSKSYTFYAHFTSLSDPLDFKNLLYRIAQNDNGWHVSPYSDNEDTETLRQLYEQHVPDGYLDAIKQDRVYEDHAKADVSYPSDLQRYLSSHACWLFADETKYVDGMVITEPRFAWETEDGDAAIAFWCNNGTDSDVIPSVTDTVTFNDVELPAITFTETVAAHSNTLVTVIVPGDQLSENAFQKKPKTLQDVFEAQLQLTEQLLDKTSAEKTEEYYVHENGLSYNAAEAIFTEVPGN